MRTTTRKEKRQVTIAALAALLVVIGAFFLLSNQGARDVATFEEKEAHGEKITVTTTEAATPVEVTAVHEKDFMQDIHEMSHQKIHANKKWGALQITPERIEIMLQILEETDYEHEEFYRDALEDWAAGDFSNAVDVHNQIWRWQGGTTGIATRLATEEEEAEYEKKYFNK